MGYDWLRKLVFSMDAERAHDFGLRMISAGFVSSSPPVSQLLNVRAYGQTLPHPIGLAAGFDKNGIALEGLYNLGFSHVEVGTVTPLPQPGNERPRMWRYTEEDALVNKLGFNSHGAVQVAKNLERVDTPIIYGINIGKNKQTPNEEAWRDYGGAAQALRDYGHYFVVNVSSPNTPGLRALQATDDLKRILDAVLAKIDKPLYAKVSPDQDDEDLVAVAEVAASTGIAGIIATNTTIAHSHGEGGLSGKPLRDRASEACRTIRQAMPGSLEVIGVGGIFSGHDLRERLQAGAAACQIYTSFVYRGPPAVRDILNEYIGGG
ncbi:MAG: quinone-dependent dihydroorotate dehydrogenase [Fimbriimonadales bacterium]